jgi:hypothetical protein
MLRYQAVAEPVIDPPGIAARRTKVLAETAFQEVTDVGNSAARSAGDQRIVMDYVRTVTATVPAVAAAAPQVMSSCRPLPLPGNRYAILSFRCGSTVWVRQGLFRTAPCACFPNGSKGDVECETLSRSPAGVVESATPRKRSCAICSQCGPRRAAAAEHAISPS